jgi:type 1 glutamine amidotransferase
MKNVVIVAGEGEYHSDVSMRAFEGDLLAGGGYRVTYRTPDVLEDMPTFPESSIDGLEALDGADLLVIYTRFRRLPDANMRMLADYLRRGGAVLGLRTSSHAFMFPEGSPWRSWNDGFGRDVLGSPWVSHHGHTSSTDVVRADVQHPVLEGVDARFHSRSWLYVVELSGGCQTLLSGTPVQPERAARPGAVAWVREPERGRHGRVMYTSLGHPEDFGLPAFRRLVMNGIAWCTDADESA